MSALGTSIFSFIFVTIIGAVWLSHLQHRYWIRQHRISSKEKVVAELKSLFNELDQLISRRLFRTRRLLYALRRFEPAKFESSLRQYDGVVAAWNERRNSFQIRLVRVVSVQLAQDFEHDLSRRFISVGGELERIARMVETPANINRDKLTELEIELDQLSRSVYEFLRTVYIQLQKEESELYLIDKTLGIPESEEDLDAVSTWFLVRALFIPVPKLGIER